MFEVCYVTSKGTEVRHVAKDWSKARKLIKKAIERDSVEIDIEIIRVEIWLVDLKTGSIHRVIQNAHPTDAAKWAKKWSIAEKSIACLLVRQGEKPPAKLIG